MVLLYILMWFSVCLINFARGRQNMKIDPFDKFAMFVGGGLLILFLAALSYANFVWGIKIAICETNLKPFTIEAVIKTG